MEPINFLEVLADESAALLDVARRGDPMAPVPGCPDWTVSDLVWHVGGVHDFWEYVVRTRPAPPADYTDPERPDEAADVLDWAATRSAAVVSTLRGTDVSAKVWTWSTGDDVAWVIRRMAHETAVHRVDAEAAVGVDHRLAPELAADGIDELLSFFLGARFSGQPEPAPIGGSAHLHCTDADGEWTVTDVAGGGYLVERTHAKGDVALRGPAQDLLSVLWGRRTPDAVDTVDVFGDASVAEALLRAVTTA